MNLKYFTYNEFDSPDLPGSGRNMNDSFLEKLDKAREFAGIPFSITSGYRTATYNQSLADKGYEAVKNSAHRTGLAADIVCDTANSEMFKAIINSLIKVGFRRFGIGKSFIHVDHDKTKPFPAVWVYDKTPEQIKKAEPELEKYLRDLEGKSDDEKKKIQNFPWEDLS